MLTDTDIDDLIHLRMPERDAREVLASLTPDRVDAVLFRKFVDTLRATCERPLPVAAMDCCGTGGSGLPHFNVSTTVAFILAAGDIKVAKFGNRAASSLSGSFDLLERIGIPTDLPFDRIPEVLDRTGLVFLFAPRFYPALRQFTQLRKSLGVRTIFNFIGPLLHPMQLNFRLLGVSDPRMQRLVADCLAGDPHLDEALVVTANGTLDEATIDGTTVMLTVKGGKVSRGELAHQPDAATRRVPSAHTPEENFTIFQDIVSGKDTSSIHYETVCLNAGLAFWTAGQAYSVSHGVVNAKRLLAWKDVQRLVEKCRRAYADATR